MAKARVRVSGENWVDVGKELMQRCLVESGGEVWLSAYELVRALRFREVSEAEISGPAGQVVDGLGDWVVTLVCSHPTLIMEAFGKRHRKGRWPNERTLRLLCNTRGMLVCTGYKESSLEKQKLQFRYSFSFQELLLVSDMPNWVKQGYIAFKYTVKSGLKRKRKGSVSEGRANVCSYHLKTVMLWALEMEDIWKLECPFRFMMFLVGELRIVLHSDPPKLQHYFIPECNLFQYTDRDDLNLAKDVTLDVQQDPLSAIIQSPEVPHTVYGEKDAGLGAGIEDILESFRSLSSGCHDIQQHWQMLADVDNWRYGYFRNRRRQDANDNTLQRPQPKSLATMLEQVSCNVGISQLNWQSFHAWYIKKLLLVEIACSIFLYLWQVYSLSQSI